MDSRTRRILERMAEKTPVPSGDNVDDVRLWYADLMASNGPGPQMWKVDNHHIDAGGIPVRVYRPTQHPLAVIVYYHGGGWVAGSIATTDTVARKIAERTGCAVVVPEYRLAPEHRYPVAVSDAFGALEWAGSKVTGLMNGNVLPLIVAGEGAGGNLAAAVTLRARDVGAPSVGLQILVSPILTCDLERSAVGRTPEATLFPNELLLHCVNTYVPDSTDRGHPDASPVRASNFQGLPATVLLTAEYEPVGGATTEFAENLRDAGVSVQLQRYRSLVHGAFSVLQLPIGEKPFQGVVRAARAYTSTPERPLPPPADKATLAEFIEHAPGT